MIVCEGTPKEIIRNESSITAQFLRKELESSPIFRNLAKN
jgi:excinuclease UvrABC ATPase subunit